MKLGATLPGVGKYTSKKGMSWTARESIKWNHERNQGSYCCARLQSTSIWYIISSPQRGWTCVYGTRCNLQKDKGSMDLDRRSLSQQWEWCPNLFRIGPDWKKTISGRGKYFMKDDYIPTQWKSYFISRLFAWFPPYTWKEIRQYIFRWNSYSIPCIHRVPHCRSSLIENPFMGPISWLWPSYIGIKANQDAKLKELLGRLVMLHERWYPHLCDWLGWENMWCFAVGVTAHSLSVPSVSHIHKPLFYHLFNIQSRRFLECPYRLHGIFEKVNESYVLILPVAAATNWWPKTSVFPKVPGQL